MARRRDAAQRTQAVAEEPAQQQKQQGPATSPQQQERGVRRRRQQQQPAADAAAAPAAAELAADPVDSMSWWQYYPWQYGGIMLGALSCYATLALYDQEDPQRVWKMMGSLGMALAGLAIHETRPFKRMNYGDKAREQGMGIGAAFGL